MASHRWPLALLLVLILLATTTTPLLASSSNQASPEPVHLPEATAHLVDGGLAYLAAHPDQIGQLSVTPSPSGYLNVIAQFEDLTPDHELWVDNLGGTVTDSWERFDALVATMPLASLPAMTRMPGLEWLEPETVLQILLDESVPAIGTDQVWTDYGLRGEDTTIAIVDTGIDGQHESLDDLDDNPSTDDKKVIGFYDARSTSRGEKEPLDAHGHGSHCSGIAAGTGGPDGTYRGVAPQAYLVGVLVGDGSGIAQADLLNGIEWTIANKERFSIDVMSMSLGGVLVIPGATNDGNSAISQAADEATEAGMVVTIAVGNGNLQVAAHAGSVSAPADSRRAITVGNVDNNGNRAISSSRGPTGDGRMKPDVMAPGTGIMSVQRNSGDGYTSMSGTSMSTPHVAGLAALMLQANPDLAPDSDPEHDYIKQILHETSRHEWGDSPDPFEPYSPNNQYGWGTVDAPGAVKRALDLRTGLLMGPDSIPALTGESYRVSYVYTKSEYTYQGQNGDSHNPPTGSEAPDTIDIEVGLPSHWPQPTDIVGEANEADGLSVQFVVNDVEEVDDQWVISATFEYSGDVDAGELWVSEPTLTFTVNAPNNADQATLWSTYKINDLPGDGIERTLTVFSDPPDLIIDDLSADPDEDIYEGDEVEISIDVVNQGDGFALSGTLKLYLGDPDDDGLLLDEADLGTLAPDDHWPHQYLWNTTDRVGEHELWAIVGDSEPDENDVSNNDRMLAIEVQEPAPAENEPPTVTITDPDDGDDVSDTVDIEGTAYDPEGLLQRVEVKIGEGGWRTADGTGDWTWEWDTQGDFNGEYTLLARAFDGELYSEPASISVTVDNAGTNARPTARLSAEPDAAREGQRVTFDASASSDDGEVVDYNFDFGDGGMTGWVTEATASHSYSSAGEWTASVKVRDDEGVESANSAQVTITVTEKQPGDNEFPVAEISRPDDNEDVVVMVRFVIDASGSYDPDGSELTYLWESDVEGELSTEVSASIYLEEEGLQVITLTVMDLDGDIDSTTVKVIVLPAEEDGGPMVDDDDDEGLPGPGLWPGLATLGLAAMALGLRRRR